VGSQGVAQAERAGVKVGEEIPADVVQPEKGFDVNPGLVHYQPNLSKYPATFKQQFLESVNKFYSPDTMPGLTRGQFGELLKKNLSPADLQDLQTLVWAEEQGGAGGYQDWAGKVLSRKTAKGELYPAGNLPLRILGKFKEQPRLALVVVEDKAVLQMAGQGLTAEEIAAIPGKFTGADWYRDKADPAVLLARVKLGESWLSLQIRTDQKVGQGVANRVIAAEIGQDNNPANLADYKKL
jgi:hypothetical protein